MQLLRQSLWVFKKRLSWPIDLKLSGIIPIAVRYLRPYVQFEHVKSQISLFMDRFE